MIEKQNSYTNVRAWMSNDRNIKKNELIIYAYIHGWSYQKTENEKGQEEIKLGCYTGSINNLVEWTKLSRSTVIRALKNLVEKEYIVKKTYSLHEGKNDTRCVYYSTVSRIPGKVEELESKEFSIKTPLDLLCEQINDSFILTPGVCHSDTGNSISVEPNKLINNLVNNTAAVEADADIYSPQVATKNQFSPDKAEAAAVFLNKKIKNIFGTNPFDRDFVPELSQKIANSEIEVSQIEDFLSYVDKRVIEKLQKKGGSHTNFFRFLCLAPDVLNDYVMSHPAEKDKKTEKHTKPCPVCESEVELFPGVCDCCGFDLAYSNDKNVVNRELQIFKLDPVERADLKNELDSIYFGFGLTFDPVKLKKQKEMISAVYKNHRISCAEAV